MSALDQTGEKRGKSALGGAGTQERALTLARHLRSGHRVRQAAVWRKEPFEPRINRTLDIFRILTNSNPKLECFQSTFWQ